MSVRGETTIKPTVYIDSCLIIELVKAKRNVALSDGRMAEVWFVERFLEASLADEVRLITSTVALVECIRADEEPPTPVAEQTKQLFVDFLWSGQMIELVAFDPFVAERARDIRWVDQVNIKCADAIHVATALLEGAVEFLTMDDKLKTKFKALMPTLRNAGLSAIVPSESQHLSEERRSADMFGLTTPAAE